MKVTGIAALLLAETVFAAPANDKRQFGALSSLGTVACLIANHDSAILGSTGSAFRTSLTCNNQFC